MDGGTTEPAAQLSEHGQRNQNSRLPAFLNSVLFLMFKLSINYCLISVRTSFRQREQKEGER